MNEPRPAMISARPPLSRSSVAKSWKTRIGSSELITLTALVRRICSVREAAAPSTTAGADTAKSGRWCSPHPEHIEANLIGQLHLLDQVAKTLTSTPDRRLTERVDPDL